MAFARSSLVSFASSRMVVTLVMMGLRGGTLVSKFLLTFFVTKMMGLADLGLYGLIASGATLVPALWGLGLNGPVGRALVGGTLQEVVPHMATRLLLTSVLHVVTIPLLLLVNMLLGGGVSWEIVLLAGIVLILEHLAVDIHALLIARHRATLAAFLLFLRSGAWPFAFMAGAWIWPAWRTMEMLLVWWLVSLVILGGVVVGMAHWKKVWSLVALDIPWLQAKMRAARPFYLFDMGAAGSQYLDRFLLSFFLGLEAVGIYTFFFSLANALYSLVYFGVIQPFSPRLVEAAKRHDRALLWERFWHLNKAVWGWCVGLGGMILLGTPYLLDVLHKDALHQHLGVLGLMLGAMVLRTASEPVNQVFYALHKDRWMATVALGSVGVSAVLTCAMAPLWGVTGVAWAAILTAAFLMVARVTLVRRF